ncbi:polyadenylate-binding protein-interacting protein 1-like isoform X2 [Dysidea avara]|uniref:polyadenylate-binding protein-interacting protein 1-like isoform X2 n=1 Tax=Dysidea avara TaxID=196820 RepID=UPI00331B236A
MSATSSGGRGRGRGTTAVVSAVGKGKVGQTTPPSTVPPEIEEIVRAQKREMEELARQLEKENGEAKNSVQKPETAAISATQFKLDPTCPEFVPSHLPVATFVPKAPGIQLNVDAPEFIPQSFATTAAPPPVDMSGSGCQISAHGVTVAEMVTPFMESVPDKELFLLDLAAELLLKCAASPELFETEIDYLLSTISQNTPQPSTLENMAKLIIIWGEKDPTIQFVASKFSAHCFLPLSDHGFTKSLIRTIQEKVSEASQYSDPHDVIRFTTFLAELFFRIRTKEGNPVWHFGAELIKLFLKLLSLPYDQLVVSIINMLKLTGKILDGSPDLRNQLDGVFHGLQNLQGSISSHVQATVEQLFVLRGNQWNPPTSNVPLPAMYTMEDDTVYFGNTDVPGAKDQQQPFQPQQQMPVVNPADWSEFIIEEEAVSGNSDNNFDADFLEEDDFEAAYEEFLQETNSHYRMYPSYHP